MKLKIETTPDLEKGRRQSVALAASSGYFCDVCGRPTLTLLLDDDKTVRCFGCIDEVGEMLPLKVNK